MELNQFIEKFAGQFDETEASVFTSSTEFKNLDEWSSLMELYIVIMINQEFKIEINGQDIRKCSTIEEVYNMVVSRI